MRSNTIGGVRTGVSFSGVTETATTTQYDYITLYSCNSCAIIFNNNNKQL